MKQALLSVRDVSVDLNRRAVLRNIGFDVEDGEFFSLLGPSGCGKTTLLRLIAGFLHPTSGRVLWNGADITRQPAQKRDLNLVFQNYALFPHMNVFDNVAFGLRMKKIPAADVRDRTREALTLVRMEAFAERRIYELSGGQQQRVALARAVAPQPKMVLLDEPLGALDLQLRKQMQVELKTLQQRLGMTFIYVTHDQEEAFAMSDRIAILNQGDLEQVALPEGLYRAPASKFVAQFIGSANFLPAHMEAPPRARCGSLKRDFEVFVAHPNSTASNTSHALQGEILIRPEQFALSPGNNRDTQLPKGKILLKQYLGSQMRYHIQMNSPESTTIRADLPALGHPAFDTGTEVHVAVTADHLPFFPGTACK